MIYRIFREEPWEEQVSSVVHVFKYEVFQRWKAKTKCVISKWTANLLFPHLPLFCVTIFYIRKKIRKKEVTFIPSLSWWEIHPDKTVRILMRCLGPSPWSITLSQRMSRLNSRLWSLVLDELESGFVTSANFMVLILCLRGRPITPAGTSTGPLCCGASTLQEAKG